MRKKWLKVILPILVGVGILACIMTWLIVTSRVRILPPKKILITITDDLGREVTIEKIPQRIISLSPSNTEILFALGLGDKVVGVTDVCNYPPEAKEKEKIGGYSNPSLEKIIDLKPDLILAAFGNPGKLIEQLENLNLIVVGLNPKTIEDIFGSIELVGKITDEEKKASELVKNLRERVERVTFITKNLTSEQKPGVLYVVWYKPLWTAGSGTFIDELIQKAGGVNIAGDLSGWPKISLETVIEKDPRIIIVGESADQPGLLKTVKDESVLAETDAFKNNQIYAIDTDIVSRTGPRIINALEEMAKIIHPELF